MGEGWDGGVIPRINTLQVPKNAREVVDELGQNSATGGRSDHGLRRGRRVLVAGDRRTYRLITPDWHPIRDKGPGIDGLFCAVGFSGHGFKLSPAISQAMAELILQGQATSVDLVPLRYSRFAEGDLLKSSYRYHVLA